MRMGAGGRMLVGTGHVAMREFDGDGRAGDWDMDLVVSCLLALVCALLYVASLGGWRG